MKRELRRILSSKNKACNCCIVDGMGMFGNLWQNCLPTLRVVSWVFEGFLKIYFLSVYNCCCLILNCYLLFFMFHRCLALFSKKQFLTSCPWNGNLVCFLKLYCIYLFIIEINFKILCFVFFHTTSDGVHQVWVCSSLCQVLFLNLFS